MFLDKTQASMAIDNGLTEFSARLNALCDAREMPQRGRAEILSKKFTVTREAARKWIKAMGYPTLAKRAELCQYFGVTDVWLMSGKGDKTPITSDLSPHQRTMIEYMQTMTLAQQQLAVKLVSQLLDEPDPEHGGALVTGTGRQQGIVLHQEVKKRH